MNDSKPHPAYTVFSEPINLFDKRFLKGGLVMLGLLPTRYWCAASRKPPVPVPIGHEGIKMSQPAFKSSVSMSDRASCSGVMDPSLLPLILAADSECYKRLQRNRINYSRLVAKQGQNRWLRRTPPGGAVSQRKRGESLRTGSGNALHGRLGPLHGQGGGGVRHL